MPWKLVETYDRSKSKERGGAIGLIRWIKPRGNGANPRPKNLNNDPNRAPGMYRFEIEGMTIYAGSYRAAVKKRNLIIKHTT